MTKNYVLKRTGDAPISFSGDLIATSSPNGDRPNRYHDLNLYKTAGGKFILHIHFSTQWQGENSHDFIAVCGTPGEVVSQLKDYDPTAKVKGYPDAPQYRARQQQLHNDLRSRYEAQMRDLLDSDTFAEVIE